MVLPKKQARREQKESYMSSHKGGLKMKEKEMREGITVRKMKEKQ